jgi:hypothetical protein
LARLAKPQPTWPANGVAKTSAPERQKKRHDRAWRVSAAAPDDASRAVGQHLRDAVRATQASQRSAHRGVHHRADRPASQAGSPGNGPRNKPARRGHTVACAVAGSQSARASQARQLEAGPKVLQAA